MGRNRKRIVGPPRSWRDLFISCPDIAQKILMNVDTETVVACRKVYREWRQAIDSCKLLIERINTTPITQAAKNNDLFTAKYLISQCYAMPDIDDDKRGRMPLNFAAMEGHIEMAKLLIENDANPNAGDSTIWGATPLVCAALKGQCDMAEFLIMNGADVSGHPVGKYQMRPRFQRTALMYAAMFGHCDMIQLLVDKGADVNATTKRGRTALMFASKWGHCEAAKLLIENGADVRKRTENRVTALMKAAASGSLETAELLISKGANPRAVDKDGDDVIEHAVHGRKPPKHMIQLLLSKGAQGDWAFMDNADIDDMDSDTPPESRYVNLSEDCSMM